MRIFAATPLFVAGCPKSTQANGAAGKILARADLQESCYYLINKTEWVGADSVGRLCIRGGFMRKFAISLAAASLAFVSVGANAATVFTQPAPTGILASPGSVSYSFSAGAGAGLTTFDINGFLSLDGLGSGFSCGVSCDDLFTLNLNGTAIYSAYFALGGAGVTSIVLQPLGATATVTSPGIFQGGLASLSVPLTLQNGTNTLTFSYTGFAQGLRDEGFGISNVLVTGNPPVIRGAVPEPATWGMMLIGFGAIGATMRRRRAHSSALAKA